MLHHLGRLRAERLRRDPPGRHRESASADLAERLLRLLKLLRDDLYQLLKLLVLDVLQLLKLLKLLRHELEQLSDLLQRVHSVRGLTCERRHSEWIDALSQDSIRRESGQVFLLRSSESFVVVSVVIPTIASQRACPITRSENRKQFPLEP